MFQKTLNNLCKDLDIDIGDLEVLMVDDEEMEYIINNGSFSEQLPYILDCGNVVYKITENNKTVAYFVLEISSPDSTYLNLRLFEVMEEYRGTGVGRFIIALCYDMSVQYYKKHKSLINEMVILMIGRDVINHSSYITDELKIPKCLYTSGLYVIVKDLGELMYDKYLHRGVNYE